MTSTKMRPKLSVDEQLRSIQNKLAWLEQLTKNSPVYQPARKQCQVSGKLGLNKCSNEDVHNNYHKGNSPNKLDLISQLDLIQQHVITHIERLQQLSLQVERLHKWKQCIVISKRRFHFNAIVLEGLQMDVQLQQKLHCEMEKFLLNLQQPQTVSPDNHQ